MYYTVYALINKINNKIYVGVHKTGNLQDDYFGSGTLIRRAIKKYGQENFEKIYLGIFDSQEQMYNMESKLVDEEFCLREDTYNLMPGGFGNWTFVNQTYGGTDRQRQNNIKANSMIPVDIKKRRGKTMGQKFGGSNKLTEDEVTKRLELIKSVDLSKYGWVSKVAKILKVSHTHARRFANKYCKSLYKRTSHSSVGRVAV